MKRIGIISILAALQLLIFGCTREEPQCLKNVRIATVLPLNFKPDIKYNNREIVISNQNVTYKCCTNEEGVVEIPELIPDVYTINTCWELTGAQYKELLNEPINLEDRIKVLVTGTLPNTPIFSSEDLSLVLEGIVLKDLVISKIYYSGTKDNLNRNYSSDQFVEVFNNSDETVYIDGKYIALTESRSPAAFLAIDNPEYIYARQICKFPGNGTEFPVYPGQSIVIAARSARNHTISAANSVDLSCADFEVKDYDGMGNPDVLSLPMYSSSTATKFFNLLTGAPNGVFLFETDEDVLSWPEVNVPGSSSSERFRQIPVGTVIDGVEALKNETVNGPNVGLKRLQNFIDAGFVCISASTGYVNESVERKVCKLGNNRVYLQDTNNSSEDFVVINGPTPRDYQNPNLLNLEQ